MLGNTEDDYHALGRRMVAALLEGGGWDVRDLGNDVPPVDFVDRALEAGAKLTGCPVPQHYTDTDSYAQGQGAVFETFRPDILFSPFMCTAEGEALESRVQLFDRQPPNMVEPAAPSPQEVAAPESLGILGIRERALMLGGTVEISGVAGRGTTVRVHVPLVSQAEDLVI